MQGGDGAGQDGFKKFKLISAMPHDTGLKSCSIPAPPPLWGQRNPQGTNQGGVGQNCHPKIKWLSFPFINNFWIIGNLLDPISNKFHFKILLCVYDCMLVYFLFRFPT